MSKPRDQSGEQGSQTDRVLHDWLQTARAHRAPPELAAAIRRRVTERAATGDPLDRILAWAHERIWRSAAVAAVPLALGLVAGWFIPHDDDTAVFAQMLDEWSFADAAGEQDHDTLW